MGSGLIEPISDLLFFFEVRQFLTFDFTSNLCCLVFDNCRLSLDDRRLVTD